MYSPPVLDIRSHTLTILETAYNCNIEVNAKILGGAALLKVRALNCHLLSPAVQVRKFYMIEGIKPASVLDLTAANIIINGQSLSLLPEHF